MNIYFAEIRHQGNLLERLRIEAINRRRAVHTAQLHYWGRYKGTMGPAHQAIVLNDPYREVFYSPKFNCSAKTNHLLPEDSLKRVLWEAAGELVRDTRTLPPHAPHGSVRRVRRRRDFGVFIAPLVRSMKSGRLYYRINVTPQVVHHGRRYRKRKYRDIPLTARTLAEAVLEIKARGLFELNARNCIRTQKCRRMQILEHLAGLVVMTPGTFRRYRQIIAKYSHDTTVFEGDLLERKEAQKAQDSVAFRAGRF